MRNCGLRELSAEVSAARSSERPLGPDDRGHGRHVGDHLH